MNMFIIEPEQLAKEGMSPGRVIVDLSRPDVHAAGHIAGAQHLDSAYVKCTQIFFTFVTRHSPGYRLGGDTGRTK